MFVATFQEVNNKNGQFTPDQNGNLPFIGTVRAGKALGTIINGTVFDQQGYKPNKGYLCQNTAWTDPESGVTYQNTEIVQELSALDTVQLMKELGAPRTVLATEEVEEEVQVEA